jgi:glutamate synthase (ferredoxin)
VSPVGEQQLKDLIQTHYDRTRSPKAKQILENWSEYLPKFWQLVPASEKDSPEVNPETAADRVLSPAI